MGRKYREREKKKEGMGKREGKGKERMGRSQGYGGRTGERKERNYFRLSPKSGHQTFPPFKSFYGGKMLKRKV
jgi:hypothetical protein